MNGCPLNVLILEDRPDDAEMLTFSLEDAGYEPRVVWAQDREQYTEALTASLDVILADYTLPSFTVPEALEILQASGLNVPLIVVSGTISEEIAVVCLQGGAADFLVKGRLARLPQAVEAARTQRRLRDEHEAANEALRRTADQLALANAELRRADEFKNRILAMTSHELRTPLTSILGYSQLLHEMWDSFEADDGRKWIGIVERQARHLSRLVGDLLTLTRLETDKVELHLGQVPIAQLIAAVTEGLPLDQHVVVTGSLAGAVEGDEARLQQVLTNLIGNAARHGGQGTITLDVEERDGCLELAVSDNGPGIPEHFVPLLFEKFAQAEDGHHGGLGLGLAISRELAEAHGGRLDYSPVLPHGARFTLALPKQRVPSQVTGSVLRTPKRRHATETPPTAGSTPAAVVNSAP